MPKTNKSLSISDKAEGAVTDGTYAQELLHEAFPIRKGRNITAAIGEAFEALKRRERSLPKEVLRERDRQWTERRVRSLWSKTARRVDHYEIQDLTAIAVQEARHERQRLREREARLAAFLAREDAVADRAVGQQPRRVVGRLDLPGTDHAVRPEDHDQSQSWG